MRSVLLRLVLLSSLMGCASVPAPYTPPPLPPAPPGGPMHSTVEEPGPLADGELSRLMDSDPLPNVSARESLAAIQKANAQALVRPRREDLRRAVVIYPYREGAIYAIDAAFRLPTMLVFDGSEQVKRWYGLDDFWDLEYHVVGDPPNQQGYLMLTPKDVGLQMDLTVLTSKRIYVLSATSHKRTRMTAVRWRGDDAPTKLPRLLNPGVYYTDYDITVESGSPAWTPVEVWDTGLGGLTLVKFPPALAAHEAPVLYVVQNDGQKHLTNWTRHGEWYVLHRVLNRAELRVGHTGSEVVMLARGERYRAVRCPESPECPQGVVP